jgi:hypothetical protein
VRDPCRGTGASDTRCRTRYRISPWGVPVQTVTIYRRNGYLYLDHIRLISEVQPGPCFASDGGAVDFREQPPTWRNIPLQRIAPPAGDT